MIKTVIFDLDGTLADTLQSLSYCTNKALADFGYPALPAQAFRKFVGNGARMQITRALRALDDVEIPGGSIDADGCSTVPMHLQEVLDRYLTYFEKDCMYQVKPYAGIMQLLAALREKGVTLAVFSNKPHENTVDVVRQLFGAETFTVVQGQTNALRPKPAPDGVEAICRQLGAAKDEILYVGDSCVDMDTGKAAGVFTIGVLWGFRDREELIAHGADALIGEPMELLSYVTEESSISLTQHLSED